MLKKEDLFYCYSLGLFHDLKKKGYFYILKGINEKTGLNYWVFEKSDEIIKIVKNYSKNKL